MSPEPGVPVLRQVVLDTTDVRALAEFYRQLLTPQPMVRVARCMDGYVVFGAGAIGAVVGGRLL